MPAEEIIAKVKAKFSDAFTAESTRFDDAVLTVRPAKWPAVAKWLRNDAGFTFLSDLAGVDLLRAEQRFMLVYTLTSMDPPHRLRINLPVEGDPPKAPSVVNLWPAANFHEREAFDMFGIVFDGHPDLRRILMPDEWEGHPLRKDYAMGKVPVEYKHLSPGFS